MEGMDWSWAKARGQWVRVDRRGGNGSGDRGCPAAAPMACTAPCGGDGGFFPIVCAASIAGVNG